MAALADTCKTIKGKLDDEIRVINNQTPDILRNPKCAPDTKVGKLLSGLSAKTPATNVENLAGLSEAEESLLKTRAADLENDPARVARQLQAQKTKIDKAEERLNALAKAVSDENIASLHRLHNAYTTARAAATLVSADLFSDEPLPEVGSDVWRSLWEAARTYSNKLAYPKREFPATGDDARCVLCHQALSPEASVRLSRFESFVLDESKKREDKARKAYELARSSMLEARISMQDVQEIVSVIRDGLDDAELAKTIKRCVITNTWRLRSILKMVEMKDIIIRTPIAIVPDEAMATHTQELEKWANSLLPENGSP
ncbi:conserved hypothetical protein, partial [methanotrophic bacterial endosymbiont of Bathymodiolus sp.]